MKIIKLSLIIILLLGTATSFSKGEGGYSTEYLSQNEIDPIIYATPYEFRRYSYWGDFYYGSSQWLSATSAGLYKRSAAADGEYVPELAASDPYNSLDDQSGLTKIVKLRDNLRFWDGSNLTVDDVVFTYHAALTAEINPSSYGYLKNHFTDKDSISVENYNDDTIRFELSSPYPFWMDLLDIPIVSQDTYQNRYDECLLGNDDACVWNSADGSDGNGAGPFFVSEIIQNTSVVLTKNPYYYDAADTWSHEIIFKTIRDKNTAVSALRTGGVDIIDSMYNIGTNEFDDENGVVTIPIGSFDTREVSLNHKSPYWGTGTGSPQDYNQYSQEANRSALNVRKAMSHAVNRPGIINQIYEGQAVAASTTLPSISLGHLPASELPPREYNISLARQYMLSAGYDVPVLHSNSTNTSCDIDIVNDCAFSITVLSYFSNPIATSIASSLPKVGIGINQLNTDSLSDIYSRSFGYEGEGDPPLYDEGGYDIVIRLRNWGLNWNPGTIYSEDGLCSSGGGCINYYNYLNKTVEQLVVDYSSQMDYSLRENTVKELQRALYADIPVIPLTHPQSLWAWRENILGIDPLLISINNQEWNDVRKKDWSGPQGPSTPDPPVVNHPADISFEYGETGRAIQWQVYNSYYFEVYKDGESIQSGDVNSNGIVMVVLDNLSVGVYTYKIIASTSAFNTKTSYLPPDPVKAEDTVIVTVNNPNAEHIEKSRVEIGVKGSTIVISLGILALLLTYQRKYEDIR